MTRNLGRWRLVLGIAVASTAGLVAAGEILARALVTPPVQEWIEDLAFSKVRVRDASFERSTLEVPSRRFQLKTNALGLRGSSLKTVKKPAGVKRIFFLGGSSTDLADLPEDETFPGRVEALLKAKGVACEVVNAGFPGGTSASSYHALEHRVSLLEPDLVVVLDGANDLALSLGSDWDSLGLFRAKKDSHAFGEWLVRASRLALWIHGSAREEDGPSPPGARRHPLASVDVDLARGIPRFVHYLQRDALVCREISCPLVLLTVPTLYKETPTPEESARYALLDGPLGLKAIAPYNRAVRDVAAETKATLVDLDALVPKNLEHFLDDSHPTSKGCEAVAQAIVAAVVRDGKLLSGP